VSLDPKIAFIYMGSYVNSHFYMKFYEMGLGNVLK